MGFKATHPIASCIPTDVSHISSDVAHPLKSIIMTNCSFSTNLVSTDVSAGDISAGDISAGDISAGDICAEEVSCCVDVSGGGDAIAMTSVVWQ